MINIDFQAEFHWRPAFDLNLDVPKTMDIEYVKKAILYVIWLETMKCHSHFKDTLIKRFDDEDFVNDLLSMDSEDNLRKLLQSLKVDWNIAKKFIDNPIANLIREATDIYTIKWTIKNDLKS